MGFGCTKMGEALEERLRAIEKGQKKE